MVLVQIVGVQNPVGLRKQNVRAFGFRTDDAKKRIIEVPLTIDDATAILAEADQTKVFPILEVEDNRWCHVLDSGNIEIVSIEEKEPS